MRLRSVWRAYELPIKVLLIFAGMNVGALVVVMLLDLGRYWPALAATALMVGFVAWLVWWVESWWPPDKEP